MEKYFPMIVEKVKTFGIQGLNPHEVCLTCIIPAFSEYFNEKVGKDWHEYLESYLPYLVDHLENSEKAQRFAAGKMFLQCLDSYSISEKVVPKYSIPDDSVLKKLALVLRSKHLSLMQLLISSDKDCDGFMSKYEFVCVLEKLEMSPYDIIAAIRIAGFRPGVDFVPIASFCDLMSRQNSERKLKEFNLFTKIFNLFCTQPGGIERIFKILDKNRDGHVTLQEFRQGLLELNLDLSIKECKYVFAILDRDNSKSISLNEFKAKLAEVQGSSKRFIAPVKRTSSFDPPGEFVLRVIKGDLPHDATLQFNLQNKRFTSTLFPVWGEIFRIKATKTIKSSIEISYNSISSGPVDISSSFNKELLTVINIGCYSIEISLAYEKLLGTDYKETQAAIVIQKAWRKYNPFIISKLNKKLLTRKAINSFNRRFLLAVYTINTGYYCLLFPADTNQIPSDTTLSTAVFPQQSSEILLENLQINQNLSISLSPIKLRIKGNLWVELVKVNNVRLICLSFVGVTRNLENVGDKVEFPDIRLSQPSDIYYSINETKGSIYWIHSLNLPFRWTVNSIVSLPGKASFSVRFKWIPGPRIGEIEQAAAFIQKQWKQKKIEKTILERKRFKKGGKSYLITISDDKDFNEIKFFQLESNGKYTELDSCRTRIKDPKVIFSKLKLIKNKITLE